MREMVAFSGRFSPFRSKYENGGSFGRSSMLLISSAIEVSESVRLNVTVAGLTGDLTKEVSNRSCNDSRMLSLQ
jgi:hypothetical protein